MTMSGVDLIRAERIRQVQSENYTPDKDTGRSRELQMAAAVYALGHDDAYYEWWPWALDYYNPKTRKRDLIRAGALIAAAIDSLEDYDG